MGTANNKIILNPSFIVRILGGVALLLVLASITGQLLRLEFGFDAPNRLISFFSIDRERNLPTFFSVLLLLCSSLLLLIIATLHWKMKLPHFAKWIILSIGFLLMAFDEAFVFHEKLADPVRMFLDSGDLGIFYFTWVIPGIAVVIVLGLYFFRFLMQLPPPTRIRFILAAFLYLGGAIGVELLEGRHAELHGFFNWTFVLMATVEESLEMVGLIVFIWALLKYCGETYRELRFDFST